MSNCKALKKISFNYLTSKGKGVFNLLKFKMHFFIENLKISNFLSFFGEYEITLKPYTAIMCNYYEGRDDFFRALEFVFGAELTNLRIENPLDLVHKALQEEFLVNHSIRTYVEVTLNMVQENKRQKFRKSIKNGSSFLRIEHRISDAITSKILYEQKLTSLSLNIKAMNLIFYKNYFNNAIWGCSEDLERIMNTCLRNDHLLEEWKRARREVEYLTELKRRTSEKHYNSLKKSHLIVAKYTDKYEKIYAHRETIKQKLLEDFAESSAEESPSLVSFTMEEEMETEDDDSELERVGKIAKIKELETKSDVLTGRLHDLKLKESVLISHLYHQEIKLIDEMNVLEDRIKGLKEQVREKENILSSIWGKMMKVKLDLKDISQKISSNLLCVNEIQTNNYLHNRLTPYGRFFDYLQPSRYLQLLKQIIGDEIYFANLCDSTENALYCMNLMKMLRYERRETFLIFKNYSHKLIDVLVASGEKGIQINTLEQLLIFLCKLKHFEIIDEVPIIVQKDFNYDAETPIFSDYTVYERSGLHFMKEGLITLKTDGNSFCMETLSELQKNFICLRADEELKYQKLNDLFISRWEALTQMNSLEDDISYLKRKLKRRGHTPPPEYKSSQISDIYADYSDVFTEPFDEWQIYERESQVEYQFSTTRKERLISDADIRESIKQISNDLKGVCLEKIETQEELESVTEKLRLLDNIPPYDFNFQKYYSKFNCPSKNSKLFFEIEFNKLKTLMANDDLEDFLGSQEWRKNFITSLVQDFIAIKKKLKNTMEIFKTLSGARKKKLSPFLEHCNKYLGSTFHDLMDDAIPFIKLSFNSAEESLHLMSSLAEHETNTVEIKHFNTFLKFISVLAVFLEVAIFDKIPIMILDELEEFFPLYEDNLEAVLNSDVIEKIIPENQNARFHLLMRVGQCLLQYIKKNTPGNHVRNNGDYKGDIVGPMQILYFAKDDLINAAEHYVWIHSQILPDEYISEDCNSYSEIHEIKLDKPVNLT